MRMAKNPTSSRNRHLDTRTQFVRDAVDYLQITPLYTPTDDQPADGLTKAVGADVIRRHLPYYTGTCACPDMHNTVTAHRPAFHGGVLKWSICKASDAQ